MRILALLPVLAVVACVDSPMAPEVKAAARASASQVVNEKTEVFSMPVLACNGELVDLSGTVHTKVSFDFNPDGSFRFSSSNDYKLKGIGSTTGTLYNAIESFDRRAQVIDDNSVSSNTVMMHMIAQGKEPDTVLWFSVRTTVVDGEVKQQHVKLKEECK